MARKGNTATVLAGLLAGAAAGVILGMLFAPEDGKTTRKKLRKKQTIFQTKQKISTMNFLKKQKKLIIMYLKR